MTVSRGLRLLGVERLTLIRATVAHMFAFGAAADDFDRALFTHDFQPPSDGLVAEAGSCYELRAGEDFVAERVEQFRSAVGPGVLVLRRVGSPGQLVSGPASGPGLGDEFASDQILKFARGDAGVDSSRMAVGAVVEDSFLTQDRQRDALAVGQAFLAQPADPTDGLFA